MPRDWTPKDGQTIFIIPATNPNRNNDMFDPSVLERMAAQMKGQMLFHDNKPLGTVLEAEITESEMRVLVTLPSDELQDLINRPVKSLSMGCQVAPPPKCSICDEDDK